MSREKNVTRAVWTIHILCFLLMLAAIYTGFRYSGSEYFIDAVKGYAYEDSKAFGDQMSKDIRNAIRYARLAARFETEGELNLSKTVQTLTEEDGSTASYTLQDALDYGEAVGVSFDANKQLVVGKESNLSPSGNQAEDETEEEAQSALKNGDFDATFSRGTVGDGSLSRETVLMSLLYQLSEYYALQQYLGESGTSSMNFLYRFILTGADGATLVSTNAGRRLTSDRLVEYGKYYSISSETGREISNLPSKVTQDILYSLDYYEMTAGGTFEVLAVVDTAFVHEDPYRRGNIKYNRFRQMIRLLLVLGVMILAGMAVSFFCLIFLGRKTMRGFDLWYIEFSILGELLMLAVLYWGGHQIRYGYSSGYYLDVLTGEVLFALAYLPAVSGLLSLIRRFRQHRVKDLSLCFQAVRGLREGMQHNDGWCRSSRPVFHLIMQLSSLCLMAAAVFCLMSHRARSGGVLIVVVFLMEAGYLVLLTREQRQQKEIFERIETMAQGDVGRKLDEKKMTGAMKSLALTVNALDDSLEKAVQERTRSERMRTELIANVSHDLRTPLTSIVNYVDLLQREHLPDPKIQGYLNILEEKAARLRTMAETLMDASRFSSGNLTLQWERIDMVQMLGQVHGEFRETMEKAGLEPVIRLIPPPAVIMADGKLLWRVLDNLYSNVCKYAQRGTRVYIELQETAHSLIYTMKNVSASPLNIPADELTERFIRGDVARSTEGSGLGLSIAKSVTERLHGKFELFLDGDYFRVRLVFPLADAEELPT